MNTIAELFQRALRHHQGGELAEAEAIYRQILAQDSGHADSLHLLGFIEHQKGNSEVGVTLIRRAIALNPSAPVYHGNLGIILIAQGYPDEAIASYRNALRLYPRFPDALCNLAIALQLQGQLDEALECTQKALRINPRQASALNIMGNILKDQHLLDEAAAAYRQALEIQPQFVDALANLGLALWELGKLTEAVCVCRQALSYNPDHASAYNTLGIALKDQGQWDEAICYFENALRLKQDYPSARWNLALLRLGRGEYEHGWPDFEIRWRLSGFVPTHEDHPRWDGRPFPGKTLLIHAEQGLGDSIQFIRYAPLVKKLGGRVLFECQPLLMGMLAKMPGIDQLLEQGSPLPSFDLRIPLLSLPGLLNTRLATVPADVPYLHADPERVRFWRRELEALKGFKIGIVWQGNPTVGGDRMRSFPLACFEPLARLPGVHLVSLQKGPGASQMEALGKRFNVLDLNERLASFEDTAAVMMNLDLIVTSCTSVVHLAGALAAPVWVVLQFTADWRWLLDREDSPWYPTARLFRQRQPGDWNEVFERVAIEVQRLMTKRGS